MSCRRGNGDLLKASRLMKEMSLGGPSRDSLENQRDIPRSGDLMQSVPDDVLAEIFQAGTLLCRDSVDDHAVGFDFTPKLPFPNLVSSVSRRWRDVALSSPRLWTTIVFNCDRMTNYEGPSLWIERSGACLLDITISVSPWNFWEPSDLKSAMDQIIPHISRWYRFTVETLSQNTFETVVAPLRTASAPYLRDLKMISDKDGSLSATDVTSNICDHIFTGGAPSLAEARLIGPYCMYTPPFTRLTYLQLGGCNLSVDITITADCLRDLLTASPFLTDLILQRLDIVLPLNTSVSDIQIPSLCSLAMISSSHRPNFWKLFSLLSLPKLETLVFCQMSPFGEMFIEFGPQSYSTVTVLELVKCGRIHQSLAKSLYSSLPSIIHFSLIESSGMIPEPHVRSDSDGPVIWPHLKTVTISYPLKYETICDFIDDREKMGHPLETVNVWSRIEWKIAAVIKLDNESKSNPLYLAGLESAIKEVEYEEYDDREERFHPNDYDRYGDSD
jgi:F-box-like